MTSLRWSVHWHDRSLWIVNGSHLAPKSLNQCTTTWTQSLGFSWASEGFAQTTFFLHFLFILETGSLAHNFVPVRHLGRGGADTGCPDLSCHAIWSSNSPPSFRSRGHPKAESGHFCLHRPRPVRSDTSPSLGSPAWLSGELLDTLQVSMPAADSSHLEITPRNTPFAYTNS